ncbi:MAG: S8 family serine peptidase, partial [Chloroflexota bacterium]
MPTLQERLKNAPSPELETPTPLQFLLLGGVLIVFITAPLVIAISSFFLDEFILLPPLAESALLILFLLPPIIGVAALKYIKGWGHLQPFIVALILTFGYLVLAIGIRAIATPLSETFRTLPVLSEPILRLIVLTPIVLVAGGYGLRRVGVPNWMTAHAFGFDPPPIAGFLTVLSLIAIATVGWPLTGALGDRWIFFLMLIQALAWVLPEEIFFRGAILGIITFNFQHRKILAALAALFIYVAFTPTKLIPHNEWGYLTLLISGIPFAFLMIELRALTGSIWAGILFAWLYRAAPLVFTDPRDELPLITQPAQSVAHLWMFLALCGLMIILWGGRQFLTPRWSFSRAQTLGIAAIITLFIWGLWIGVWTTFGHPGFYNDGFIIVMSEQADLSDAQSIDDSIERRAYVYQQTTEVATRTQQPIREALEKAGLSYRSFHLINLIQVERGHRQMENFVALPGVDRVMFNPNVRPYPLSFDLNLGYGDVPQGEVAIEWNIEQVQADKAWDLGVTGQNIVVGGQDTGYFWQHPALCDTYRGAGEGCVTASDTAHTYNWHDAWDATAEPFDDGTHGTHTMGTILGKDNQGNQVGMAPDAEWVGCRNMRRGLGNPASYLNCMEFFLAPYPLNGDPFTDGDVAMAPHIINNSWACPDFEGCDDTILEPAIDALRAAGIMMVSAAGNSGPRCQTVFEPPSRYDNVFSVGATDKGGQIVGFSSRGPTPSQLLKPDISAPGAKLGSSLVNGSYGTRDGTSMASPHVAGLVALL